MLIRNPDFEQEWDGSHKTLRLRPGELPVETFPGNIFVPAGGWVAWFTDQPENELSQPEVRYTQLPERVQHGQKAMLLFTMFRKHAAGFLQQIPAIPNVKTTLTAWAHAWSNWQAGPHPDDPKWSEGPGFDAGYLPVGEAPNDEWRNFTFYLGIDPTGGIDARADSVIWGLGAHIYNKYAPVPPVEVVPLSDTITIFLCSSTLWSYKHNDAYWDNVQVSIALPECRGKPREQYERTYVLLPPDTTLEEAHTALDEHFEYKRTIGFSADDAGVGDLDSRGVIAYRPSSWPGDLKAFYEKYYPGVQYLPVEEPTQILLWMRNLEWRDYRYALGRCYTIGAKGCWICCSAMAQRWFEIDLEATPLTVDTLVGDAGYDAECNMRWDAMPKLGLEVVARTTDATRAKKWIDNGAVCFIEVAPTTLQHFVMATKYEGDRWWVFDPLKNVEGWLDEYYEGVDSFRHVRPYTPPNPNPPIEPISFHIQSYEDRDALDQYISEVKPEYLKIVGGMEQAWYIKSLSSNTKVGYRQHVTDQGQYIFHPDGPQAGAKAFIDTFRHALYSNADAVDYVESVNEEIPTGDMPKILAVVQFEIAFCNELEWMGFPARPITLTAGVGNPQHGPETRAMIPAVEATIRAGGGLGPHVYWGRNYHTGRCTMLDGDWEHFAGRPLESWDPEFAKVGLAPDYFFGEGGPIGIAAEGSAMYWEKGWRHPDCLNGNRDVLVTDTMEFRRRVFVWNATHGNRAKGVTLFTVFFQWHAFQYWKPEFDALRIAITG